jgi:hypothetical protein
MKSSRFYHISMTPNDAKGIVVESVLGSPCTLDHLEAVQAQLASWHVARSLRRAAQHPELQRVAVANQAAPHSGGLFALQPPPPTGSSLQRYDGIADRATERVVMIECSRNCSTNWPSRGDSEPSRRSEAFGSYSSCYDATPSITAFRLTNGKHMHSLDHKQAVGLIQRAHDDAARATSRASAEDLRSHVVHKPRAV